jgi:DNA polymerase-3 subunit epsilon
MRVRGGQTTAQFEKLLNPDRTVPAHIAALTGITNQMLSTAPTFHDISDDLLSFVGNDVLVGHNVSFDVRFLFDKYARTGRHFGNDYVDTRRLCRRLIPEREHYRLSDVTTYLGIATAKVRHRAMADVEATNLAYQRMVAMVAQAPELSTRLTAHPRTHSAKARLRDTVATEAILDDNPLRGYSFTFTGTLERMVRSEAAQRVVNCGGLVNDNVTKRTNYLVMGETDYSRTVDGHESRKTLKAQDLLLQGQDIYIIPESVFDDMLAEVGY